jgi:hypothetical protein
VAALRSSAVPCPSPSPRTSRDTTGSSIRASSRALSPPVAVKPESLWTGESQFGGSGYAALGNGGSATVPVGNAATRLPRLVIPVVDLQPGSTAVTRFRADGHLLGSVASGDIGPQGDSPAPGALLPVTLSNARGAVHATTTATGGDKARLDALMLEPVVSRLVLGDGDGHGTALLRSAATQALRVTVSVPGSGPATVERYDGLGQLVDSTTAGAARGVQVWVPAGGFTIVRR